MISPKYARRCRGVFVPDVSVKERSPNTFLPARVATKEVTLLSPVLMAVAILAVKNRKRPLRDGHVLSAFKSSTRNRGRIAASRNSSSASFRSPAHRDPNRFFAASVNGVNKLTSVPSGSRNCAVRFPQGIVFGS